MANTFADDMAQIFQRQYDGGNTPPNGGGGNTTPSIPAFQTPKILTGTAGGAVGSPFPNVSSVTPSPIPPPRPQSPAQPETPVSNAAQQVMNTFPKMDKGFAQVLGAPLALAQGIGGAFNNAFNPTTGSEVGAVKTGDVWRVIPGIGLGEIGAEALGAHDALQTPLRDVPVLGAAVRAGEAVGGMLNQGSQVIGEPLATATALAREATPKPLRDLIRSAPVQTASPLAGVVSGLWGRDNPEIFQAAGTTSQEAETLTRGFLTGQNTPDQNRRLEEIVHRAAPSEGEANPIPHTILTGMFDPLTYADAGAILPKIGEVQQLRRVWAAAGDVTKAGETLGEASPIEHLIAQVLTPKSIGETELLSKDALGMVKPADQNIFRRLLRPFGDTPTSNIVKNIERMSDNLMPFLADGGRAYEDKVKFLQLVTDAAQQGKRTPELIQFMTENGVKNAEDLHRAMQALAGYKPEKVTQELTRAREVIASLEQTTQTTKGSVFNPEVAGFLKGQGENLGGAYQNIFDAAIQGWKEGKIDLEELKRGVESIAGVKLANDTTAHMAETLSQYAGIKPPRFVQRLLDTMKAYEGMLYIGTNPASMVNNIVGDVSRLSLYGVNPATAAQEFADLSRRVGYKPPENIGTLVRSAINGKQAEQVGAYGASLPKWVRDVPGLKQMSEAFDKSQVWGRQAAWATGFERFLNHNFVVPELSDVLKQHLGTDVGKVTQQLKGARNTKEALDILVDNAPTWEKYSQEIADDLTRKLTDLAGKDFQVTPNMLADAFPESTRQQFRKTLQSAWEAVQRGEDAPTAFRRARAQIYSQDLASDTFKDLFPDKPRAPEMPMTEPLGKAQPQYRKPPEPPIGPPVAPLPEPIPPTEPPPTAPTGLRTPLQRSPMQIDKGVQDFAKILAQEEQMPNVLKGMVDPSEWGVMDEYGRRTLLERTLSQQKNAGQFGLSDVYQARGDVPTAMPDVSQNPITNVAQPSQNPITDLSDVFQKALERGVPTATEKGRTVNQHILNVLNKHKGEGVARFTNIEDVKARADEAMRILEGYTPEVKVVGQATHEPVTATLTNASVSTPQIAKKVSKGTLAERQARTEAKRIQQTIDEWTAELAKNPNNRNLEEQIARKREQLADAQKRGGIASAPVSYQTSNELPNLEQQARQGGKVKIAGEEYTFVKSKGDGTITVSNANGDEFDTSKGEVWQLLDNTTPKRGDDISALTREQFVEKQLNELRESRASALQDVRGQIARVMERQKVIPPTGYSADQYLKMLERPKGELRRLKTQLEIAEKNLESDMRADIEHYGNVYDTIAKRRGRISPQLSPPDTNHNEGMLRVLADKAKEQGAGAAIDPELNKAWHNAIAQNVLDTIEQAFTQDALKGARVLPPEVLQAARAYLKQEYSPALREALQGANAAARQFQEATVLNYDHRWNIDDGLATTAPFAYWWLHTLGNDTKDFVDHPAMLAFLLHLRENFDKQSKDMPARFQHRVQMPFPLASRFGLGDSIWVDPLRSVMPFADVYQLNQLERATYNGANQDGTPDMGGAFNDLFGIHTPYKLAYQLLTNDQKELQNTLASVPALRLIRGATSPFVAGGVNFGLNGKYDQAYYERALKELTAEGTITPEQAKIALLQQSGDAWQQAKQRAGLENYGIREMTGLMGARGYAMTPGEQKLMDAQKQSDQMQQDAVKRLGGNPSMTPEQQYQFLTAKGFYKSQEWQDFRTQNPELETTSFVNKGSDQPVDKQQEVRYRDYLANNIWDKLNGATELQGKLWKAQLGDTFYNLFYKKDTRNVDAIPTSTLLGWANALDTSLPNQVAGMPPTTPEPFKVTFPKPEQSAAYQSFYDEVGNSIGWDKVAEWGKYQAGLSKDQRNAWFKSPDGLQYKVYLQHRDEFFKSNPDVDKLLQQAGAREPQAAKAEVTQGAVWMQALQAVGYGSREEYDAEHAEFTALPKEQHAAYLLAHPRLLQMFNVSKGLYGDTNSTSTYAPRQPYVPTTYTPRPRYNRTHGYSTEPPRIYMNFAHVQQNPQGNGKKPHYNFTHRIAP